MDMGGINCEPFRAKPASVLQFFTVTHISLVTCIVKVIWIETASLSSSGGLSWGKGSGKGNSGK